MYCPKHVIFNTLSHVPRRKIHKIREPFSPPACYRDSFTFFYVVFIVCNASFIVCLPLWAVFCLSVVCYIVWYVYFCVLRLIVVPLPPGKTPLAIQLNNNFVYFDVLWQIKTLTPARLISWLTAVKRKILTSVNDTHVRPALVIIFLPLICIISVVIDSLEFDKVRKVAGSLCVARSMH
jgi:hypothetical protein